MKTTIEKIKSMKGKERISMLTAYDYSTAKYMDEAGIDIILIGDSLGMVILGYDNTLSVTMEDIMRHTGAVSRGTKNALVVADMPANSYNDNETAVLNAEALIKSGADCVKLENKPEIAKFLVENKIDVMGHIGLTPQSVHQFGGFKVQGKTPEAAIRMLEDARALEEAGAFSIVLETVPTPLATLITQKIGIPTIGIGAGIGCDGQDQVINDILGSFADFVPKHAKQYAKLTDIIQGAVTEYYNEVRAGSFPTDKQSFSMDESILAELKAK